MLMQKMLPIAAAVGVGAAAAAAVLHTGNQMRRLTLPETEIRSTEPDIIVSVPAVQDSEVRQPVMPDTTYLLSLSGDVLSVYADGQPEPIERHTVPAGLPDYDRILLEYGMQVSSENELRQLMEDYLS